MRSTVLATKEPIDPRSKAYLARLRRADRTKSVHPVDPYAEVYTFRDGVLGIYSHSADGMGDPWSFLVIGPRRAMLIDTGFGIGDLRGLVDELTGGMPLVVVNTHPHIDHCYGNSQFATVHCHENAVPYLLAQRGPQMWDHLLGADGRGIWLDFDPADVIGYTDYEVVGCADHTVFDLGDGHEVELVWLPGHHAGHCAYLDRRNRILFGGDVFVPMRVNVSGPRPGMPHGESATVTALQAQLVHLARRTDEFDSVFPGHFIVDLDTSVVPALLEACTAVVADPRACDYEEELLGVRRKFRHVKGLGVLAYTDRSV